MNDKQQLAAMGEHMAEQAAQPMCMAKRIEELEAQVLVMAELLREAKGFVVQVFDSDINYWSDNPLLLNIDAALVGKMPSANSVAGVDWSSFPGWLIDHHEGDTITEEMLQFALADMLAAASPEAK